MIKKINKLDVKPKEDPCGLLRELYNSKNLSIAHDIVTGESKTHLHKEMEEVYYIEKGEGQIVIGKETISIKEGDIIPIPKNTWHYLKKPEKILELIVITHPKFNPNDLILKENQNLEK
ncbi:MAG: cupin domain-containing protein [archaeon]